MEDHEREHEREAAKKRYTEWVASLIQLQKYLNRAETQPMASLIRDCREILTKGDKAVIPAVIRLLEQLERAAEISDRIGVADEKRYIHLSIKRLELEKLCLELALELAERDADFTEVEELKKSLRDFDCFFAELIASPAIPEDLKFSSGT